MKTMNFWRTLFFSALAVAAFTGCKDDDDDVNGGNEDRATITVDGKSAAAFGVKEEAGETVDVKVVSSGDWILTYNDTTPDWLEVSAMEGKSGESTVTFTVKSALPEDMELRSAAATFQTRGFVLGKEYWAKATVTITQSASGSPVGDTNVAQIRALLKAMNPGESKVDVTEELAAMTIRGVVVSEASGKNWGTTKNIAIQDADGAANSGLTLNASTFETLALSAGTVVSVPLTGAQVQTYKGLLQLAISNSAAVSQTPGVAPEPIVVTPPQLGDYESMLVKIDNCYASSGYNTAWYNADGTKGNTNFTTFTGETFVCRVAAGASFASEVIPEKAGSLVGLSGQFNGTMQVSPRVLADIQLTADIPAPDYTKITSIGALAAGNYELEGATIVGVHSKGVMFGDATGYVLAFNNAWDTQTSNPYQGDLDKTATIKGASTLRYGLYQFSDFEVTVGAASSFTLPTPEVFDAAAITAYADAIKADANAAAYKYVALTGVLNIVTGASYNTYTLEVAGLEGVTVQFAYGLNSYFEGFASGDAVDVKGFALGFDTNNNKLNVLLRSIEKNTTTTTVSFTSEPTTFAATSPAEQTIGFAAQNLPDGSLVDFDFTGDDAAQFSVVSQTENTVTIKAVGDNTSDGDYMAVLTASVNDKVLDEVHVRQLAPAGSDTRGTYTSMSIFVSNGASTANPAGLGDSKVGEANVSGFKIGTGKAVGTFTSEALGVTGSKKLGFYAVGYKGKSKVPLTITIIGGGSASVTTFSLNGNDGATNNPPFTALTPTDEDYYVVELSDLTAATTIKFATTDSSKGRAVVFGVQLFD